MVPDGHHSLKVTEIFHSLQGESSFVGLPTAFVRLTGCPLRCQYCDTEYAFHGGRRMPLADILDAVRQKTVRHVTVTGGEPLAQDCLPLLTLLCDEGYEVSLETSGALDISGVDPRVSIVMDWKTPASGEMARNLLENINHLKPADQVKFVICDRADYEWARLKINEHQLGSRVTEVLFSASFGQLDSTDLANWILEDELPVRLQVQLHKLLWGDKPGV